MDAFKVGEIVDVPRYGKAEVLELVSDPASQFVGRVRVRYQSDGKVYHARPETLRKVAQVKQRVILCHSTTHYRTAAAAVVNWDDTVLEVGAHEGDCTAQLARRCRYAVGVDKSAVTVEAARRRHPGLRFEAVDGFDVPALKALGPPDGSGFSVVCVDIGGIAALPTVAHLVGLYYKEFPWNTRIVVKSVFLKRLMENCLPYNPARSNPWELPGPGEAGGRGGAAQGGEGEGGAEEAQEGGEEEAQEGEAGGEGRGGGQGNEVEGEGGAGTEGPESGVVVRDGAGAGRTDG